MNYDLVEVFSVRVFSKHGSVSSDELYGSVSSDEIYGSIVVDDYDGCVELFKRTEDSAIDNYVLPDGSLSLQFDRCTQGGFWAMRLKLYHKKGDNYHEICNGFLSVSLSSPLFDRPMTGIVEGRDGLAFVNMVMLSGAVQAKVEVFSLNKADVSLYGIIHARNDLEGKPLNIDEEKYFRTTLLYLSKDKPFYTNGGQIPLSRSMTCVRRYGELKIEAGLYNKLTNKAMAVGNARFDACDTGTRTETIGCIQVKVTWSEARLGGWRIRTPSIC